MYVRLQCYAPVLNLNRGLLFLSGYVYSYIKCKYIRRVHGDVRFRYSEYVILSHIRF